MQNVFNTHGDAAFAGVIAHEYGHGVMHWSGFAGRGQFRYQLMREGFADCMAGAWVSYMYNSGHTDGIGRGDGIEVVDSLAAVGAASTRWDNHGDARWRSSAATYGWNVGFRGCLAWGRQIAAA